MIHITGYIIRVVQKGTIVSTEEITVITNTTGKNPDAIKDILAKPSDQTRYIVIFLKSKYLQVFYGEAFEVTENDINIVTKTDSDNGVRQ